MSRPASQALGGFYATPVEVIPAIASLVRVTFEGPGESLVIADPCAGEGVAVARLAESWVTNATGEDRCTKGDWRNYTSVYACEMEATRYYAAKRNLHKQNVVHSDAFLLKLQSEESVHILWHNPPYDVDRGFGRLEERWLRRFGPLVATDGTLLHFVPFYSLAASAQTIARMFDPVYCFRLPEFFFSGFKQVVLVGRRRPTLVSPSKRVEAQVRAWSADASSIPELPLTGLARSVAGVSTGTPVVLPSWSTELMDLTGLLESYEPWSYTDRAGKRVHQETYEPRLPYANLMSPRLRLGCAPRPAHIAIAAGAGVLSGAKLTPDPDQAGPDLLIKGIHRRTYKHLRWREKDGERVAEERQQHPELQLAALNLKTYKHRTLTSSMEPSGSNRFGDWTVGDLLLRYSQSMLAAMRERCDLIYDPSRDFDRRLLFQLSPDPLLKGQERAVQGMLKLLKEPDRTVLLLGETGVGKTRMALTTAYCQMGGRGKLFVVCPTAIIVEWKREVALAFPDAVVHVLETVDDVDNFARVDATDTFVVGVMSKEQAKLGHEWEGVPVCPACGTKARMPAAKLAERRAGCEAVRFTPKNDAARVLTILAQHLGHAFRDDQLGAVVDKVGGRILRDVQGQGERDWRELRYAVRHVVPMVRRMFSRTSDYQSRETLRNVFWHLLHALGDDELIVREAKALFRSTLTDRYVSHSVEDLRRDASMTLLLLPPWSPWISTTLLWMRSFAGHDAWNKPTKLFNGSTVLRSNQARRRGEKQQGAVFCADGEEPLFHSFPRGSNDSLRYVVERLATFAVWDEETCGEPLYQASPVPRRVPLARYILRRHPSLFDMFVADEVHTANSDTSAQSRAIQRLLSLCMRRRVPAIAMTGSIMNGYARSLFVVLWHMSSAFRREFAHDEEAEFERRYGFLVQVVEQFDEQKKERVAFGRASDRVTTRTRTTGAAPGVLPLAVLLYLLPNAITVQHVDMENDLPACHEQTIYVKPSRELAEVGRTAEEKLLARMGRDRYQAGLAGKLFGALGHLPRIYDSATRDVGNGPDGAWTVGYPESVSVGDRVIYEHPGFEPSVRLPKESVLLTEVRSRLAAGRKIMVATTRTRLAVRLARILQEDLGVRVAVLDTKKVGAKHRRAWVESVREEGYEVAIANPAALPMGLNNLVYFSTVFIFDDPNNDPTLLRQFRGRFVRIGQKNEVELISLVYEDTLQADAHDLLSKKRVIAEAADGLDVAAAFEVAGVGEQVAFEFDLGKALYARITANNATQAPR